MGQFTQEDTYRGEPNNPLSLNLYTYCYNDPVQYADRSGNSPETVLDVASLTYSAKAYREDPSFGNAISYYWDLGAVFIPIFPGTYIFKLGKWLKWGSSAVDTVKAIDNTADGAKIIENGLAIRDQLLNLVSNDKLKNCIDQMYRPGATIGDGGLADAIRHELTTGELVGGKSHIRKGVERVRNLENIIEKQSLNETDYKIANDLLNDLKSALELGGY